MIGPRRRRWFAGDALALAGLLVLALGLTGFWGAAFGEPIQHDRGEDWDWQLTLVGSAVRSWLDFHRFPTWNPYTGGGVPLLANPEFPGLHPAFVLPVWLGPDRGAKALIVLHLVIGWAGLALLGRQLGLRRPLELLPPLLLAGCSVWNFRLMWGHLMFVGVAYLPWAWWWMLRARGRPYVGALAGLALGLGLLAGGHYAFLIGGVTTVVWSLLRLLRDGRAVLAPLAAFAATAGLIALARGLPLLLAAGDAARLAEVSDGGAIGSYGPWELLRIWAGAAPLQGEHESQPTFHGWLPLLLAVPGLWVAWRRQRPLLGVFALALALSVADNAPINAYQGLRALPGLGGFRYPERFALAHAPLLALLAALGAQGLLVGLARRGLRIPAAALGIVLVAAVGWHAVRSLPPEHDRYGLLVGTYSLPAEADPDQQPFRQDPGADWNYPALRANRGCPACRDALGLPPPPPPWGEELAELEGGGEGEVERFAGAAIDLRASNPVPSTLVVRQAARPGWRGEVDGEEAALTVGAQWLRIELPAGDHAVRLRYRTPGGRLAAGALAVALLLPAGLALIGRRGRVSSG